ncbi:MAG: ammonia-forming cytochrome c nitrite reductase subunit c552 [Calditrichaeota bacterium]|nr:ammonia-forming cytochrome c nitrite reductase subunit c552 [Calditrichota bacterium]
MRKRNLFTLYVLIAMVLFIMTTVKVGSSQSTLDCSLCHSVNHQLWMQGKHSKTQMDVAGELAEERIGQSPDSVINGADAENCIACHGPLAVKTNGGMTDVEALGHFFTTEGGVFSENTVAADTANWPNVFCTSCHNVPADHPASLPVFAYFNSTTAQYDSIGKISSLCGRCHGALRFEDTDHLTFNGWKMSKHSLTQDDVAGELAEEWAGLPPDSVMNGSEPENCIACHGPTAVLANGGMTETEALAHFFTTENGNFSESTVSANQDQWPDVSCIACHNPHDPEAHSYFNSATGKYEVFDNTAELCGQCHGSLRFPDTDHRSYNIEKGVGAVGVTFVETMEGITCTDCHMSSGEEDTKASMYHGHTWAVFVDEEDGSQTAACTSCHEGMNAAASEGIIKSFQSKTQASLDSAETVFALADSVMQGNADETLKSKLDEAEANLFLVQSDESGGFHNQHFQMALLEDVIQKSNEILSTTGVEKPSPEQAPQSFALLQNYPNPFNPSTTIRYALPTVSQVRLDIINIQGEIKTLVNGHQAASSYKVVWDGTDSNGNEVTSGLYFYKLQAGNFTKVRQMIFMK